MILLLAPLAAVPDGEAAARRGRRGPRRDDGRRRPPRLSGDPAGAARAGWGRSPSRTSPTSRPSPSVEAMRLAADRDLVARQYANGYRRGLRDRPCRRSAVALDGGPAARDGDRRRVPDRAGQPSRHPDRPQARRGRGRRGLATRRGGPGRRLARSRPGPRCCDEFDAWLRAEGHARNPGATADLVAAALFAALRDGTIELPRPAGPTGWSSGAGLNPVRGSMPGARHKVQSS